MNRLKSVRHTALTPHELVPLLLELTEQFCREVCDYVRKLAEQQQAREVLGVVEGREPTEDVYVEVDRKCQTMFWDTCQEFAARGLRVRIVSEHSLEEHQPEPKDPNVVCYIDPFDGTDQFLKGIWEAWYSVFSFATPNGQDLVGGCVDLITGIMYTANTLEPVPGQRITKVFLSSVRREFVNPSRAAELPADGVVASYKGKWRYLAPWMTMVETFFGQEHFRGVTHYGWGGSFVYALLAAGVFHVYIMVREPTDEIRPGRAFVAAAGLFLASVTETGVLRRFRWGQRRRVPFFIAAANEILARSVIRGIWRTQSVDVQSM